VADEDLNSAGENNWIIQFIQQEIFIICIGCHTDELSIALQIIPLLQITPLFPSLSA